MDEPQEPLAALHTEATPPQNAANNDGGEPTEYTESVTETPETTPPTDRQEDAGDSHRATKPWWKKWSRWKRVFEVGAFILGIYFAHIYSGQLDEMRRVTQANTDAVRLAFESLELSRSQFNRSMSQTITQTTSQYQATQAGITSAKAASSAAHTAVETLHISERAYLAIGKVTLEDSKHAFVIPVINIGHLPSREVTSIVHKSTVDVGGKTSTSVTRWRRDTLQTIAPNTDHNLLVVPIDNFDSRKLDTGNQTITVTGTINYNDGFPNTPSRRLRFCITTEFVPIQNLIIIPCSPDIEIPKLEKVDGYPSDEKKDK